MNRTPALACALASLVAAHPLAAQPALDLKRAEVVADSMARATVAAGLIPGIAVAIAKDGRLVFEKAYGKASVELDAPATTETVWRLRSVTKQYTAAAIMRLVEQGKVALDDPVTKHLPDAPVQGRAVTIRHLLTHTAGLQTKSSNAQRATLIGLEGGAAQWHKLDLSYAEMLERFGKEPFEFEPGTKYDYNNFGYWLLGHVIAKASGRPYAQYVEEDLLRPLGLARTWFCDDHRVIPGRADGYEHYDGRLHNTPYVATASLGAAAGALCATVGDAARWAALLHAGRVVSPASVAQMATRQKLAGGDSAWYGFGMYVPPLRVAHGHRKLFHGGTRPGFGAYVSHYPDDGLTVAVLSNGGTGRERGEEIDAAVVRAAFGAEARAVPIAAAELARYAGTYAFAAGERTLEVRVFVDGGALKAHPAGQKVLTLVHQGSHGFVATEAADIRLVFDPAAGRATLHQRGREIPGTRK